MKQHSYIVYILECNDGSYYTGMTSDFETRIHQHQLGVFAHSYTFTRRPVKLVYSAEFTDVFEAIAWERRIKRWSKSKRTALINSDWNSLKKLSKKRFKKSPLDTPR